jgi:hypothetical protein
MSGYTKAELQELIDHKDANLRSIAAERDEWQRVAEKKRDAESVAIDGCVRAIDKLTGRTGQSSGYYAPGKVERILRYLADRYDVDWYDPPAVTLESTDDMTPLP